MLGDQILAEFKHIGVKGSIILSPEGINLTCSATKSQIEAGIAFLKQDLRFADIVYKFSYSKTCAFKRMIIKVKPEIITFKQQAVIGDDVCDAPYLSPAELKRWYKEKKDMVVLDTRNDYEVEFGTFKDAVDLNIENFTDFTTALEKSDLDKDKTIVTFCTGGVRCEKAAVYMKKQGFKNVYQLDGGIIKYLEENGDKYYDGECFVFDHRVGLNGKLQPTGSQQCEVCGAYVKPEVVQSDRFIQGEFCPRCPAEHKRCA